MPVFNSHYHDDRWQLATALVDTDIVLQPLAELIYRVWSNEGDRHWLIPVLIRRCALFDDMDAYAANFLADRILAVDASWETIISHEAMVDVLPLLCAQIPEDEWTRPDCLWDELLIRVTDEFDLRAEVQHEPEHSRTGDCIASAMIRLIDGTFESVGGTEIDEISNMNGYEWVKAIELNRKLESGILNLLADADAQPEIPEATKIAAGNDYTCVWSGKLEIQSGQCLIGDLKPTHTSIEITTGMLSGMQLTFPPSSCLLQCLGIGDTVGQLLLLVDGEVVSPEVHGKNRVFDLSGLPTNETLDAQLMLH